MSRLILRLVKTVLTIFGNGSKRGIWIGKWCSIGVDGRRGRRRTVWSVLRGRMMMRGRRVTCGRQSDDQHDFHLDESIRFIS